MKQALTPDGTAPLAQKLPWWVTRTVPTSMGALPCLINKDGTFVVGLCIEGVDVFASDNAVLNDVSRKLRAALNTLPPEAFCQAIYETGFGFDDLVGRFRRQGKGACTHEIHKETRRLRADMLGGQQTLTRSRITFYIGHIEALGRLRHQPSVSSGFLGLLGKKCKNAAGITPKLVREAAEVLAYTVSQFTDALSAAGLRARKLSESALVAECFRHLNPTTSKLVAPPVLVETKEDILSLPPESRALLRGPSLSSQLACGPMIWTPSEFTLDDPPVLHRMLGVQRYPFATQADWMFPLCFEHAPSTPAKIVVTHVATDRQLTKEDLERRRNNLQSQLASKTLDHDAQAAYEDYQALLEQMATTDSRVFQTSIFGMVSGRNHAQLDEATRSMKKGFAASQCTATTYLNRQLFAWLSSLPGYGYRAPNPYPLLTGNCAHLVPFFQPSEGDPEPDFLFGTRQKTLHAVSWRQSGSRDNTNTFIIGSTGSGKTFLFSHILKTTLALGGHVVVTDQKGPKNSTYLPMCELLGGQYVALNATDASISFNPCPPPSEALDSQGQLTDDTEHLKKIVCMMAVPDIDTAKDRDLFMRIAEDAIAETYAAFGPKGMVPVLSDIADALEKNPRRLDFRDLSKEMGLRLRLWCEDRRRGALLNQQTSLKSDAAFQVFDFFGLDSDPQLAAVLISTLSSRIFSKMQRLPLSTPKLFGFDEAWALFDHSELAAGLIGSLFRVARSYGASCFVVSQSHKDVAESRAATAMMANASIYVLNRHNSEHEQVAEVFDLSPRQLELFRSLEFHKGHFAENLYIDRHSGYSTVLRYAPTPFELWIDTSRAIDVELRNKTLAEFKTPLDALRHLAEKHPHGAPSETHQEAAA